MSLSHSLFKSQKEILINSVIEKLEDNLLPNITKFFPAPPLCDFTLNFFDFKFSDITVDVDGSYFDIHSAKPQIEMRLQGLSFNFTMNYKVTTNPELINDEG